MAKVSIIVPVYKVEPYLERCMESLRNQTLSDLEIILVDDGSPDRCGEMCDAFAELDPRVRVVHKQNGGLSSARNAGLFIAQGQYIGFVDSDDTVDPDMYRSMLEVAQREKVDFVMSDYLRIPQSGKPFLKTLEIPMGRYDKAAIRSKIFPKLIMGENVDYGPLLSVCHCLYSAEFLRKNNLFFDEAVRWSEDNIFSAFVGYHADSFYYMKGMGLYHYHQNTGTITTSYRPNAWEVYCLMNKHLHEKFDHVRDYDFSRQLKLHMIYYACNCMGQALMLPQKEAVEAIRKILNAAELKTAFLNFTLPNVPWKLKLQLLLMKFRCARILYNALSD